MSAFLKEKGHWVRGVDVKFPEYRRHLWGSCDEIHKWGSSTDGFDNGTWWGDLRKPEAAVNALEDIDWVFHFAADMGGVGYFFSDADGKASADNMQIDLNVLRALQPGQRLFYASSFCAYPIADQVLVDGKAKRAMKETDFGGAPVEQIYGDEKRMMTILCEDARKTRNLDTRVGIFSTIYGPYQEIEDPKRSKFPTAIVKKVFESKKTGKPIEMWGDGSQIRTYLFISDFLEKAYRIMSADFYEGPVNIGSDEQVSCKEMADYVCELAGVEPNYEFQLDKPTGVMAKDTDQTKFNKLYGKVPQTSARDGFKAVYNWLNEENSRQSPAQQETS